MNSNVQYILRAVLPLLEDEQKWQVFLRFASEINADAIMVFNAHGEMPPHPKLSDIQLRMPLLDRRLKEIRTAGMQPMLNFFVTLGHGAAKPAVGMDQFQEIIDGFGNKISGCICPLDSLFQDYMCKSIQLHASVDAESLWIDDDFRLFSREGAETIQCFCDLHLRKFAERTGTLYSRTELIELLLEHKYPDRQLRRQWFALQGESLTELASNIRDTVQAVNPNMGLGLMIPGVSWNYLSGRDLNVELLALSTEALPAPWLRTGGGFWNDERPLNLLDKVIEVADPIPAIVNVPHRLCCEIENYPFVPGGKSARLHELEMFINTISTNGLLTLSITDSFLGIHDPSGNIVKKVRELKPYLERVTAATCGKKRRGASIVFPPNLAEVGELTDQFLSRWNLNLARLGIPQAPTDASPSILTGKTVHLFSVDQLLDKLKQGALLDAEAFFLLQQQEIITECPIKVSAQPFGEKVQTERIIADHAPSWMKNKNLATRWHVTYQTSFTVEVVNGGEMWSCLCDTEGQELSAGMAVSSIPYPIAVVTHTGEPMKEVGRQWLFQQAMNYLSKGQFPAMVEEILEMYPIWWGGNSEAVLGLCNFGNEQFFEAFIWLPAFERIISIERLNRKGVWELTSYDVKPHPSGGIRITLYDEAVPKPLGFETLRLSF